MKIPADCVVDTNVATTANGANAGAPMSCMVESARALRQVMERGHVYVDQAGAIVRECRANLAASGQPGPGDAFLKWVMTHEWGERKITRVAISPTEEDPEDYSELPKPADGILYDRSDRHNRRSLEELLTSSRLGSAAPEGIVIRKEQQGWTIGRAKLVRAEFTQAMETHWSRGPFRRNALEVGTTRWM